MTAEATVGDLAGRGPLRRASAGRAGESAVSDLWTSSRPTSRTVLPAELLEQFVGQTTELDPHELAEPPETGCGPR